MGLKRYIFKSGLDIIAPAKCGTRWLEYLDVENRIQKFGLHPTDLPQHIHSGTTFIWRPVREHFLSAVRTEISTAPNKTILDVVTNIEEGLCHHWYSYLYKELYPLWEKTGFRFHKLRALSELTPSAGELKWNSTMYAFPLPTEWESVEEALNSLSPKHTIRLERLISDEDKWLKSMLQSQYSKKDWEAYSDLEDELLSMKCKLKDLSSEVSRITDSKLFIGFQNTIKTLRESNTKLQAKLDYTEQMMGKPPIKLI